MLPKFMFPEEERSDRYESQAFHHATAVQLADAFIQRVQEWVVPGIKPTTVLYQLSYRTVQDFAKTVVK